MAQKERSRCERKAKTYARSIQEGPRLQLGYKKEESKKHGEEKIIFSL